MYASVYVCIVGTEFAKTVCGMAHVHVCVYICGVCVYVLVGAEPESAARYIYMLCIRYVCVCIYIYIYIFSDILVCVFMYACMFTLIADSRNI
jgi:hypothetical protein